MTGPKFASALLLFTAFLGLAHPGRAALPLASDVPPEKSPIETVLHADALGFVNPEGPMLVVGAFRRWINEFDPVHAVPSSYLQAGTTLGINPAYAQASIHGEWLPAIWAQLRLAYDLYGFFGDNGALLSFPSADSPFGDDQIDTLEGQEESGLGHRILFQPTLRAKLGRFYFRNQTDVAYYRFDGKGPFFFEREYDTLLKDGDFLIANRSHIMFELWKGPVDQILLAGPFYDVTYAVDASLTRQRIGAAFYWVPKDDLWFLKRPRLFAEIGYNLQDRNRDNEGFAVFGVGFDYDLM